MLVMEWFVWLDWLFMVSEDLGMFVRRVVVVLCVVRGCVGR